MLRRTFIASSATAVLLPSVARTAVAQSSPNPRLFRRECLFRGKLKSGMMLGDALRVDFLSQTRGKLLPATELRTFYHQRLQAKWKFECAYDGPRAQLQRWQEEQLIHTINAEIVGELEPMMPLRLLAVDSAGIWIDPNTFEPELQFYAQWNEA